MQVREKKIAEMIRLIKKLIFPTLLLLIVLAFYLLNKDINEYAQIIKEQQISIDKHEALIETQGNILVLQGARISGLENGIIDLQIKNNSCGLAVKLDKNTL